MTTAVGATAPQATGFVASVQSYGTFLGAKVWAAAKAVFSTVMAHKFLTLGVVGLCITAYVYRAEIKAQWDKCVAGCASKDADAKPAGAAAAAGDGSSADVKKPH